MRGSFDIGNRQVCSVSPRIEANSREHEVLGFSRMNCSSEYHRPLVRESGAKPTCIDVLSPLSRLTLTMPTSPNGQFDFASVVSCVGDAKQGGVRPANGSELHAYRISGRRTIRPKASTWSIEVPLGANRSSTSSTTERRAVRRSIRTPHALPDQYGSCPIPCRARDPPFVLIARSPSFRAEWCARVRSGAQARDEHGGTRALRAVDTTFPYYSMSASGRLPPCASAISTSTHYKIWIPRKLVRVGEWGTREARQITLGIERANQANPESRLMCCRGRLLSDRADISRPWRTVGAARLIELRLYQGFHSGG